MTDENYDAFERASTKKARIIVGVQLKCRDGVWTGENDNSAAHKQLVPIMSSILCGYQRLERGTPPEYVVGLVSQNFVPPSRSELGETDREEWPVGLDGKPKDPWTEIFVLPLTDPADGEMYTFVAATYGAREAVQDLLGEYARTGRNLHPGEFPIVSLESNSYDHKQFHKTVHNPVFKVVDWIEPTALPSVNFPKPQQTALKSQIEEPKPPTERPKKPQPKRAEIEAKLARRGDMDDEIPF